jgi:hypothetical protein
MYLKNMLGMIALVCISNAFHASARDRADFVNQKLAQKRIGVVITNQVNSRIPASSISFVYKSFQENGFVPIYLNDVGVVSGTIAMPKCSTTSKDVIGLNENVLLGSQDFQLIKNNFNLEYVLILANYYQTGLAYNINASIVSLEDRSVIAYHYDHRGNGANIALGICSLTPIGWVAFPVSVLVTKIRLEAQFNKFIEQLKK